MNFSVRRLYVEKKAGFDVEAQHLFNDIKENLGVEGLLSLRIVNRYDIEGLSQEQYESAKHIIFAEPTVDCVYDEVLPSIQDEVVFAIEYLPGQYDQRADSAVQCIQILTQVNAAVQTAKVIILKGNISGEDTARIKKYLINPVESREAALKKPLKLGNEVKVPDKVKVITGFNDYSEKELEKFLLDNGMAMGFDDLKFCQTYFKTEEKRNPTITELKVIDTYWSDHCRHTTFNTCITKVEFDADNRNRIIKDAFEEYKAARKRVYGERHKDISLMDIATMGMKELKARGFLKDLDESEEINACSIVVDAQIDGKLEKWLVMFKNETHNHPTEIEPFGGAATCLGGAIRDPLSGRSYVYQAMRVTGSGDPRAKIADTLPGKLPQRKISIGAAAGYSSYGNQIGLATGQVTEVYDEQFIAKRMEIGAVIGAAPKENVCRMTPIPGDVVLLLGGRTGRDGCGGATGSSKEHTEQSLATCGAEVQKGNAPTERKIQRLFRNPEVSRLIKKCNDFGAGGVAVAIGELTAGLTINLDAVPKKYEGLDGTELAISESQERMAVVVAKQDADKFIKCAHEENLECTEVAQVTDNNRLIMYWQGDKIVNLSRDFLNTNGVKQNVAVKVKAPNFNNNLNFITKGVEEAKDLKNAWLSNLADLNVCSQKGLVERFDSTIGSGTVLMPFGGKYQLTPADGMVAKLPVLGKNTTTATAMTFGYNPKVATASPFHGALYAVVEAVSKIVALGGDYKKIRLTLQEYFEKLGTDAYKWGKPFSALLGAFYAQLKLGIPAIGGKDSMSGTFMNLNVPPTLVAFAVSVIDSRQVISQEFKNSSSQVVVLETPMNADKVFDFESLIANYEKTYELVQKGMVLSAAAVKTGGIAACITKMCFGNNIGFELKKGYSFNELFAYRPGTIIVELPAKVDLLELFGNIPFKLLGSTIERSVIVLENDEIELSEALRTWQQPLEKVFPTKDSSVYTPIPEIPSFISKKKTAAKKIAQPNVFIPVFPGTNCEYDSKRAFEKAGGKVDMLVVKNIYPQDIEDTINEMVKKINQAQIIMLPGGFSAGDEPDGSGKFIATMFRNPRIKEAISKLLEARDGLILGICNGFQALIKLGLVPYGSIVDLTPESPTLTYNTIGRHISCMIRTKVVSTRSPWFNNTKVGDVHTIPISHGEGRFVAPQHVIDELIKNGQVATQYIDNVNGSLSAIEGITSPDGRILGKMGHSERIGDDICKNVPGQKDQKIFEAGIAYFS